MILDSFIEITLPFILCLSAYPLTQRFFFKSRERKVGDKLVVSLIIGLTVIMLLPYSVGIIFNRGFNTVSKAIYIVSVFSIIVNIKTFIRETKAGVRKAKKYIYRRDTFHSAFILSVIGFSVKYTYYLLVRAVTDWDVVNWYLPYAKAIYFTDSIPLTTLGFARFTKPMGISFLYGWIYSLSSSTFAENFRLIPLSFTFINVVLIYLISKDLCSSLVAKLAVMIYLFLPLHDSILYYCAYYPDIAYISLILAVFYFLNRYTRTLETKYCMIGGLALGLSMLLKLQTAFFFIPIFFTFLNLFGGKSIKVFITFLTPFAFLSLLAFSAGNWTPLVRLFTGESIVVLILVAIISGLITFCFKEQEKTISANGWGLRPLKGLFIFLGTSSIALVWYLRNYFTTGTFIWLSSIKEPNLQWAINILSGLISQSRPEPDIPFFLLSIILVLLVHPILGSAWIIPKLFGIFTLTDERKMLPVHKWILGFFLSYILYAYSTMITTFSFTVNPRDLLPLAPFFSIYSAWGLLILAKFFWKVHTRPVLLFLLAFLGFASLSQSLLILYYPPSFLVGICNQLSNFSLLSWRLLAHGSFESAPNWLLFGLVIGLFSLLPLIIKKCIDLIFVKNKIIITMTVHPYKSLKILKRVSANGLVLVIVLLIQVLPYIVLPIEFGNADVRMFREYQEHRLDPGIYPTILNYLENNTKHGDVVFTIDAGRKGLQYKLDSITLMDITFPDNLAAMRDLLNAESPEKTVTALQQFNARYFLMPKWGTPSTSFMEWLHNETHLLDVIWDPLFSIIRVSSGGWILFELNHKENSVGWEEVSFNENIFSEIDPKIIVDKEHESFWTGHSWGLGEISVPIISDEKGSTPDEESYAQIAIGNGSGSRWRIYHTYEIIQNWGGSEIFSLFWYGENTGKNLNVYIDAPNSSNRWIKRITEDWVGWKRLYIHLDDFGKVGSPSTSEVKEISIGFYNDDNVLGTWYLDRVIVDVESQGQWVFDNNQQSEGLNHAFSSDGEILNFTVWGKVNGIVHYKYSDIPPLSTNEYPYIVCLVKGTENARWSFKLFYEDGTSYDFPYFDKPTTNWGIYLFDMSSVPSLRDKVLRGDAYLSVKTTDGKISSVYIDFYQIRSARRQVQ